MIITPPHFWKKILTRNTAAALAAVVSITLLIACTSALDTTNNTDNHLIVDCKQSKVKSPCLDAAEFSNEKNFITNNFIENEFEILDDTYRNWCSGKERFPDGRWKIREFENGLYDFFSGSSPQHGLMSIKAWRLQHPNSTAAKYADALYWHASAWRARGGGFSGSVTKEGWELFSERLLKSRKILDGIGESNFDCPILYALMLNLMIEQREDWRKIEPIFINGSRKFPEYHGIYFSAARALSPKWGGNTEAYEKFARRVAAQTKSFEGMGMYARLYWLDDSIHGIPFLPNSGRPPLWKDLKKGHEDLMARYPMSLHNTARFASLACRANDSSTYLSLRKQFSGMEAWAMDLGFADECDRRLGWPPNQ